MSFSLALRGRRLLTGFVALACLGAPAVAYGSEADSRPPVARSVGSIRFITPKTYTILQESAIAPDGSAIAFTRGFDGAVYLWTRSTGSTRLIRKGADPTAGAIEVRGGHRYVTAQFNGSTTGYLKRWDRTTNTFLTTAKTTDPGTDMPFDQSADGRYTAYIDPSGAAKIFDATTRTTRTLASAATTVCQYEVNIPQAIAISSDGSKVAYWACDGSADSTNRLFLWQSNDTTTPIAATVASNEVPTMQMTSDGSAISYLDQSGNNRWFRVNTTGGPKVRLVPPVATNLLASISYASFSGDGKWMLFADRQAIRRWRIGGSSAGVIYARHSVDGHIVGGIPEGATDDGSAANLIIGGWDATCCAQKSVVAQWRAP